jgi:hypothetical protein
MEFIHNPVNIRGFSGFPWFSDSWMDGAGGREINHPPSV